MDEYRIKDRKKRLEEEKARKRASSGAGEAGTKEKREERPAINQKTGGRKKKKKGGIFSTIILVAAIVVFCFSGFQLFRIFYGYHKGDQEYDNLKEIGISADAGTGEESTRYTVDFEELWKVNEDIIAWIRFDEPSIISYPVVQGKDNQEYLDKTISGYPNTYGAIFLNVSNNKDMMDKNSVIYGHRMNSKSMFGKLEEYQDEEFYRSYPYFYIYTPDGKELKYQIFAVGEVNDTSDAYQTVFENDEAFQSFLAFSKEHSFYDTGVEVPFDAKVVTLSTCTKANNEERLIVQGYQVEVN